MHRDTQREKEYRHLTERHLISTYIEMHADIGSHMREREREGGGREGGGREGGTIHISRAKDSDTQRVLQRPRLSAWVTRDPQCTVCMYLCGGNSALYWLLVK